MLAPTRRHSDYRLREGHHLIVHRFIPALSARNHTPRAVIIIRIDEAERQRTARIVHDYRTA
jgi:hypothetical protein